MRWLRVIISASLLAGLLYLTGNPVGPLVFPAGEFFNPFRGFWQNAEPYDFTPKPDIQLAGLTGQVQVVFDERRVPHLFAQNDADLYFLQGYLTARDRLWQMEFQTLAAAGRLTEIIGRGPQEAVLDLDRNMRRKGMTWAAERSVEWIEKDPLSSAAIKAYTKGVNAWIESLSPADLPLEYKILNYRPEPWSPYKSALLLKYMADMLSGSDEDVENTYMYKTLGPAYFNLLFPNVPKKSPPIIPAGAKWDFKPEPIAPGPSWFPLDSASAPPPAPKARPLPKRNPDLGSNNWAVAPQKSATGKTLLANDPHLGLNLPAIWYEMQLHTPSMNAYGVTIPGSPGIIIGFNDSIAWGVTNGTQGVADYYTVEYQDERDLVYRAPEGWKPVDIRVETYRIKGEAPFIDSVRYLPIGPVLYDRRFGNQAQPLAFRWMAHEPGNELLTFLQLNRARNYTDYLAALRSYTCPAQNFAYADAAGNIALWHNGRFVQYFPGQGKFLKDAADPAHAWKAYIPFEHNPHAFNPAQGFLASANQRPTDETYPYDYSGGFDGYRSRRIHQLLSQGQGLTLESMKQFQLDAYYVMAEELTPLILQEVNPEGLSASGKAALEFLRAWDYQMERNAVAATIFSLWWEKLYISFWDEFERYPQPMRWPGTVTTADILLDSARFSFYKNPAAGLDDRRAGLITHAFKLAADSLESYSAHPADWVYSKTKTSNFRHLTRVLRPFSRLGIPTDGMRHTLNASASTWGPSWRQVVSPGQKGQAFGIFPGGPSGNPGSRWYDSQLRDWAEGVYYPLWFMQSPAEADHPIAYRIQFSAP